MHNHLLTGAAFVVVLMCASPYAASQSCPTVPYEPESVTLHGRVAVANSRHPSGKRITYPVLQLNSPVTVAGAAGKSNARNVREECIGEIQLWADGAKALKRLLALRSKHVAVNGKLQHANNEWHMRNIVMHVAGRPKIEH